MVAAVLYETKEVLEKMATSCFVSSGMMLAVAHEDGRAESELGPI